MCSFQFNLSIYFCDSNNEYVFFFFYSSAFFFFLLIQVVTWFGFNVSLVNLPLVIKKTCEYTIKYGDGSISQGDLSLKTLTLDFTSGSSISFPKTVIGFGHNNTLSFEGKSSGLVGLGNGPVSLINQLVKLL